MNAFFAGYFRWAAKDNAASLTRLAENPQFTVWDSDRRQKDGEETSGKADATGEGAAQPNIDPALLERMYSDLGLHPVEVSVDALTDT